MTPKLKRPVVGPGLVAGLEGSRPARETNYHVCAYGHEIGQGMAAVLRAMGHDARFLEGGIDATSGGFQVQQLERVTR
jgi:rhodanese-related sulfurtransferase